MGDSRGKDIDAQFLQDLERATRLSLESFKCEQEVRTGGGGKRLFKSKGLLESPVSPKEHNGRDFEITPRPRPLSRPISSSSQSSGSRSSNGSILSPPPFSDSPSIPPPSPFKRQRSLPYRRNLTHPPISDPFEDGAKERASASDDLILLGSPLVTPKFNLNCRTTSVCDSPYAFPLDDISPRPPKSTSPTMNSPFFPQSAVPGRPPGIIQNSYAHPSVSQSPIPFYPPLPSQLMSQGGSTINQAPYPHLTPNPPPPRGISPTQGFGTTSSIIGGILHNLPNGPPLLRSWKNVPSTSRTDTSSSLALVSQIAKSADKPRVSSLYKKVSEELREMNNCDLIDFGSRCSTLNSNEETCTNQNILEYFDPLVIREAERKEAEEKERLGTEGESTESTIDPVDPVEELYNASCASTATSAFTYRPNAHDSDSVSLYPSLQEFEYESLYGTLSGSLRRMHDTTTKDPSGFYDVYNPFEYSYTVSCSSPAGIYADVTPKGGGLPPENGVRPIGFHIPQIPPANSASTNGNGPRKDSASSAGSSRVQIRQRSLSHDKSKRGGKLYERGGKLYENIESIMNVSVTDSEIQAVGDMIREIRQSCRHVDSATNKGYIRSPLLENKSNPIGYSVKIVVWPEVLNADPVTFTSDIASAVDLILEQSILELGIDGCGRDYMLRVKSLNEYLDGDIPLSNYVYVQQCIKLDEDVQFIVVKRTSMLKDSWARTQQDDTKAEQINVDDLLPQVLAKTITYDEITIPLQIIDSQAERIRERINTYLYGGFTKPTNNENGILSPASLIQPVKAVCVLLKNVVTIEIVNCLNFFSNACQEWNSKVKDNSPPGQRRHVSALDPLDPTNRRTKIIRDLDKNYSLVEIIPDNPKDTSSKELVFNSMDRLIASVSGLVEMYSKSFPVSFRMKEVPFKARAQSQDITPMGERNDPFLVRIGAIHRLKPEWLTTYVDYRLETELRYGSRKMWGPGLFTGYAPMTKAHSHWLFDTIVFDTWIRFDHIPICIIPREGRVVFTLYGRKPSEDNNNTLETVDLGWASMQFISFKRLLAQGDFLLPFWQVGLAQKQLGPAPNSSLSLDGNSPLLTVEFIDYGQDMYFPEIPIRMEFGRDFTTLDTNTQDLLQDLIQDSFFTKCPPEETEILWEKRLYLQNFPDALPKVLSAAQLWDWAGAANNYALLENWKEMGPIEAVQLLMPTHPDVRIREKAVGLISKMSDEKLINLLPQLVEALSFETFDPSPLAKFLLKKSLSSLSFSHHLFWMLVSQIGLGKWVSEQSHCDPVISRVSRIEPQLTLNPKYRRLELMLNCLMVICGHKWRSALISQYKMMENLNDIASQVKAASKDSTRQKILATELQRLSANVFNGSSCYPLPISASVHVKCIHPNPKMSSYFNSNAVPLKVAFQSGLVEGGSVCTIFKGVDDLRQDMMTLQTVRLIDAWWLKEGLDLRVLTFACIPTGPKQGMIEMVPNSETLCKIQAEYGVTGVFRDSAIADWLAKMNPSTLDYRRAVENFTRSTAAYCVITYILGICDRHNDNIMLTKKGHLFHIDFGKFLGDAQLFIKFKRDRTPFVLTSDMIYVINDGEKGSNRFHRFVELCVRAFAIVRTNGNMLLTLFGLMSNAGIPGVDNNSVMYIQDALLPDCSNVEAAAKFTRFIEESSQNWFTPVNFFLHSLAQLRFSFDTSDDPKTLSFIPTVYTMEEEGRIEKALVVSYQKNYDPEKYYSYTIKLKRKGHTDWSFLHRSYKEFLELRSKLCINFPKADGALPPLPRRGGLGRSNVKEVADKRKDQLDAFLQTLFSLADEIGHSTLVYTFFHPILRDEVQHLDETNDRKVNARASLLKDPSRIHGQIKVSLQYGRGEFEILILHAVDLACPNAQPPSTYVKTYLRPDNSKVTKRKTRVIRRSQHPSFMEVLSYRLPLEMIRERILEISVWHHDSLQENSFLGGVYIPLATTPLDKETIETYTLTNINTKPEILGF